MPDPTILKWYAEMGGKRLTFGPDAHRLCGVGLHLEQAIQMIKAVGFNHFTQFEQQQARFLPLE